jgi:hypothetical protein
LIAVVFSWFFAPILRGETYLDVASRENEVYPWTALNQPFPHTLLYDQPDRFYPWQVFLNRALHAGELPLARAFPGRERHEPAV